VSAAARPLGRKRRVARSEGLNWGVMMRMFVMAPQLMQRNPSQVEAP
jgi:hypothetical protein